MEWTHRPTQVTEFLDGRERIATGRGLITYEEWCSQEVTRLNRNRVGAFMVQTHAGEVAVFRTVPAPRASPPPRRRREAPNAQ